jgi:hypothetical protein
MTGAAEAPLVRARCNFAAYRNFDNLMSAVKKEPFCHGIYPDT